VAVLGIESRAALTVKRARTGALADDALLPSLLDLRTRRVEVGEQDHVGLLLKERRSTLVQLHFIAIIGGTLRVLERADMAVSSDRDHHIHVIGGALHVLPHIAPHSVGLNIALAVARFLDRLPIVASARLGPHQRLRVVEAVQNDRLELPTVNGDAETFKQVAERVDAPARHLVLSLAALGLQHDWRRQ
jgi:hypothetical protein